jgi:hypothetical protein
VGLLDLFSTKSSSQTQNTTTENNLVETTNRNVSGNTGLVATEGSTLTTVDNSVHLTTDQGAVAAGRDIALGATGLAENALDIVSAVNQRSLSNSEIVSDQALKSVSSAYGQALTAVSENADNTTTIVERLATNFGTRLADLTASEQTQLGNTVSALSSSYESRNTSANQQVLDSQTNLVKYVALAAAAAFLGFLLLRKG